VFRSVEHERKLFKRKKENKRMQSGEDVNYRGVNLGTIFSSGTWSELLAGW
jgi:hypothetical protein